jgi:hypothetical protein
MAKVRFQMFLDEKQKDTLEMVQKDSKIPMAEIMRQAIDKFLSEWREKKELPVDKVAERLLSVAGVCKGGPKNLADKHDGYLYGISKK